MCAQPYSTCLFWDKHSENRPSWTDKTDKNTMWDSTAGPGWPQAHIQPRITLNSWSSNLSLLNPGITGMCCHVPTEFAVLNCKLLPLPHFLSFLPRLHCLWQDLINSWLNWHLLCKPGGQWTCVAQCWDYRCSSVELHILNLQAWIPSWTTSDDIPNKDGTLLPAHYSKMIRNRRKKGHSGHLVSVFPSCSKPRPRWILAERP